MKFWKDFASALRGKNLDFMQNVSVRKACVKKVKIM